MGPSIKEASLMGGRRGAFSDAAPPPPEARLALVSLAPSLLLSQMLFSQLLVRLNFYAVLTKVLELLFHVFHSHCNPSRGPQ